RQRRASHPSRTSVRPATPSTVRAKGGEAGATQNRAAKGMRARVRAFGTAAASSWSHGLIDGHVRAGRREGHRRYLGGGSVLELFLRTLLLLIGYVLLAPSVSFLCSSLEAVLLSVTPPHLARLQQEGHPAAPRLTELKT